MDVELVISRDVLGIDSVYLSAATRQNSESATPIGLTLENWRGYAEHHANSSVATRTDKLLLAIAKKARRPGNGWSFPPENDYPLADAASPQEFEYYLQYLEDSKLISRTLEFINSSPEFTPTIAGWIATEPRSVVGGTPGRCFVAMSFDDDLDGAYFQGIKAAIGDSGHVSVRMKELLHNEDITARLLAEIRGSEYTVADFTKHRNGVYYEAAFARGLGRQVIMTCRDTDFGELHFDTSHLNHIKWSNAEELRRKLAAQIKATILPKA